MNQLKVFESPEFGAVRTVTIDDEVWFVGRDVCEVFGDTNYRRSLLRVDEADKDVSQITTPGGKQNMVIINESGLYSLLFCMQPQKAKGVSQNDAAIEERIELVRRFKHWVTSDVLPSIRKHGGYMMGQEQMTDQELLASALLLSQRIADERAARIEELETENQAKSEQLAITEPKAEYYDAFVHTKTSTNFRTTAKEIGVGERNFINLLIDKNFLYRDKQGDLLPYSEKNRGYFIVRDVATGRWMGKQTFITENGKQHFRKLCQKEGLIPADQEIVTMVQPSDTFIM